MGGGGWGAADRRGMRVRVHSGSGGGGLHARRGWADEWMGGTDTDTGQQRTYDGEVEVALAALGATRELDHGGGGKVAEHRVDNAVLVGPDVEA